MVVRFRVKEKRSKVSSSPALVTLEVLFFCGLSKHRQADTLEHNFRHHLSTLHSTDFI